MKKEIFKIIIFIVFFMITAIAFSLSFLLTKSFFIFTGNIISNKEIEFTITASAKENFKTYEWKFVNSTITSEESIVSIERIARIIKIESSNDITLLNGYVKTLQGIFPIGSCFRCRIIERKIPGEYYIKEIRLNISKQSYDFIKIYTSNAIITDSEARYYEYQGKFFMDREKINLGKISDYIHEKNLIEMNGNLSNLKYTIKTNYPIKIYFSDTLTAETQNSSAEIIAEAIR